MSVPNTVKKDLSHEVTFKLSSLPQHWLPVHLTSLTVLLQMILSQTNPLKSPAVSQVVSPVVNQAPNPVTSLDGRL